MMKNWKILGVCLLIALFVIPQTAYARDLRKGSGGVRFASASSNDGEFEEAKVVKRKRHEKAQAVDFFTDKNPFPKDKNGVRIAIEPGEIPYTLGVDDVISLHVRMHEDLSGEYVVSPEGAVFIPLLGEIRVIDMTKQEIAVVLGKALKEYIIDVEMTVAITAYRSKYIYVLGEVLFPGRIPMKGNIISLRDALVDAGLLTDDAASWRATIIRPSDVKPYIKHVNVNKLLFSGNLKYDFYLQPNDVVYVPMTISKTFNKYLGQILAPGQSAESITDVIKSFNGAKLFKGGSGGLGRGR